MIYFLFNKIFNDQDFAKLTGGTRQRGGLDSVEYGNSFMLWNWKIIYSEVVNFLFSSLAFKRNLVVLK